MSNYLGEITSFKEFGDADGDGVTDDIDTCPDTPAGTRVLADGCPNALPYISGKEAASGPDTAAVALNGFTVGDADNPASLRVRISSTGGTLSLGTTTGLTGTTADGVSLDFSGSSTDLNTALNTLSLANDAGEYIATLEVSDDDERMWAPYTVDREGSFITRTTVTS